MNWYPANVRFVRPYNKLNYKNKLKTVVGSGTRNKKFENAIQASRITVMRLGNPSTFGTVNKLAGNFVKKTMKINRGTSSDFLKIFLNEIKVGSTPGIFPRIYAWRVHRGRNGTIDTAEYIMDDYRTSPEHYKVIPFKEYITQFYGPNRCPSPGEPIYKKLKEALLKFWRLTKGYHGDLHVGNMAVMYSRITDEPIKVIIFDYGSHKKFKTATNNSTCFERFVQIIDKEFSNRFKKNTVNSAYFPKNSQIRTACGRRGQPRRPNTNMLRGYAAPGVLTSRNNQDIMARMTYPSALLNTP